MLYVASSQEKRLIVTLHQKLKFNKLLLTARSPSKQVTTLTSASANPRSNPRCSKSPFRGVYLLLCTANSRYSISRNALHASNYSVGAGTLQMELI